MKCKFALIVSCLALTAGPASAQRLFAGLEDPDLATRSSSLSGFPVVTWTNHFAFEVNGAACTPDGRLYLCNGPFTTRLYSATLDSPPAFVANITVDIHGMGYGRGQLYGFSNFASPMGIYAINPTTGVAGLIIDTSTPGYRFFGLDYNPLDDRLYGYTEYGVSGLYEIDIDTGGMTRLAGSPPGVNGQGRALAVGNDTVYLLATRGDEGESCFAYPLSQGAGGTWTPFTNPYPLHHNTGGAAWIPGTTGVGEGDGTELGIDLAVVGRQPQSRPVQLAYEVPANTHVRIEVFDATGRRAATLLDSVSPGGPGQVTWDLRTDEGPRASSGLYFARLTAGREQTAIRVLLMQ